MYLTDDEKNLILKLRKEGKSYGKIAKELFGNSQKRKTTIREFVDRYYSSYREEVTCNSITHPKFLILDIEVSPSLAYIYNRYNINVYQENIVSEFFILSYSAKFLHDDKIFYGYLNFDEVKEENDKRLLVELHELINKSDIICGHNIKKYDLRVINTKMVYWNIKPPEPYRIYDTLLEARKNFRFPSNKLNDLCVYFGFGEKDDVTFKNWKGYLSCCEEDRDKIVKYNQRDVLLTEKLYYRIRPYSQNHPNIQLYSKDSNKCCPLCGGNSFTKSNKLFYTNVSGYEAYQCLSCGKLFRDRSNILNRENLVIGI